MISKMFYFLMITLLLSVINGCSTASQPALIQETSPADTNTGSKSNNSNKIVIPSKARKFRGVSVKQDTLSNIKNKNSQNSCPKSKMERIKGAMLG